MKLITRNELSTLTLDTLYRLFEALQKRLMQTAPGSAARRNCLASLENLQREIFCRVARQWKLEPGP